MIGLSTITYSLTGSRIFNRPDPKLSLDNIAGERRATRTATLDGGCSVYDAGFSWSDATVYVSERDPSAADIDWAADLVKRYGSVVVTTRGGAFRGVPESYYVRDGSLVLKILITERISE